MMINFTHAEAALVNMLVRSDRVESRGTAVHEHIVQKIERALDDEVKYGGKKTISLELHHTLTDGRYLVKTMDTPGATKCRVEAKSPKEAGQKLRKFLFNALVKAVVIS